MDIHFTHQGVSYTVDMDAYQVNNILLPTGEMLEVQMWLESYPPQVGGVKVIEQTFDTQFVEAKVSAD